MNIIVTGASRGIGFELVKRFAANGNHTIVAISRNEKGLEKLKNACTKEYGRINLHTIPFDLASDNLSTSSLLKSINSYFTKVDILVNNAGYLSNKSLTELPDNEMWNMIKVNFSAPAQLIKLLLPIMNRGAHVVNISSMGGFQGSAKFAGLSVYSATKAALASLTECLAEEYKETGVAFNCLALGAVATEMFAEAFPSYQAPVTAEKMAEFICNFALTGNQFFNGKIIPVSLSTP